MGRSELNVLLLHYTDLKSDLRGSIQRIAKFLEIKLSPELLGVVEHKASHAYMRARDTETPGRYTTRTGYPGKELKLLPTHIKSGKDDGGKDFFTPQMITDWGNAIQKYWGDLPELQVWAQNGGSYA